MKKIIIIMFAGLLLGGCKDFLEPTQIDLIYNEVFWKTQTDAEVGLSGVYALYRGLMVSADNWYKRADATTGLLKRGWNGGSSARLYTQGVFTDPAHNDKMWGSRDIEGLSNWASFYKVVAQANLVIAKIEEIPDSAFTGNGKNRILGEAYFLRGLTYFQILRIWGNAPYLSELIESSSQVINGDLTPIMIPRTDDVVIARHVIDDADMAVACLDYDHPGSSRWGIFANKGAAQALAGHANMWMHFLARRDKLDNPSQYIENAIEALEDLRDNGNYSYVNYSVEGAVAEMYRGASTEAVFELNISSEMSESYRADAGGVTALTCKMPAFNNDPNKDRSTEIDFIPYSQKPNIYPEYDFQTHTGDIRPHLFFGAWDSEYNDAVNDLGGVANDRSKVTWLTKYALLTEDTYRNWDEYVAYFAEANIPVFRFTDVMLLLAEAYCKNNEDSKALVIVNDIRNRAAIGDYQGSASLLLEEVMQQRIGELFGEGHLYFDMVRNNIFPNAHLMPAAKYRQEGYYWPVASDILTRNTMLSQTPYWNGKTHW